MPRGRGGFPPARPAPETDSDEEIETDEEEEEFDFMEYVNGLDVPQRRRVYALKGLVNKTRVALKKKNAQLAALEVKLLEKLQPLLDTRTEIVSGAREVTDEEVAKGEKENESKVEEIPTSDDETEKKDEEKKEEDKKKGVRIQAPSDAENMTKLQLAGQSENGGIPNFWLEAMKKNEVLESMIMPRDEEALEALQNVTLAYIENDPLKGFELTFRFGENSFFSNETLVKKYIMDTEDNETDVLDKAEGTEIDWKTKESKLTVIIKEKKQRHKSGKGVRIVQREEKAPSFFHFFSPPNVDDEPEDEEEEDPASALEMDYEAGMALKNSLIRRAVYYYTGEAMADVLSSMNFDMASDDEEEEEEEEEDEEEEVPAPRARGRGGKSGGRGGFGGPAAGAGAGAAGAAGQPECKQQ